MYLFNNLRAGRLRIGRDHFRIVLPKTRGLIFCNVRKNACTAFRRFFVEQSRCERRPGERPFAFMKRHHRLWSPWRVRNSDIAVLVYRDPVERLVSLFANKFVERSDSADLAKKYEQTTGHSASRATLEDFVFRYLSRAGRLRPDPHLRRQADHLTGLLYCAIPLRRVHEDMKILVGPALADEYFARPVNAASSPKVTPSDDAVRLIRKVYAADIELLKRIEESPRLNQP